MSDLTPEQNPEQFFGQPNRSLQETLGPNNARRLILLERDLALEFVREAVGPMEPLLAQNNGFAYFNSIGQSDTYSVLVTNREKLSGEHNTIVISVNNFRQPQPDETSFPDGRTIEMTDLAVGEQGWWLGYHQETQYRGQHTHNWKVPAFATLHHQKMGDSGKNILRLLGGLQKRALTPEPATEV